MNTMTKWLIGGLVICTIGIIGCSNRSGAVAEVESVELLRTSKSWNDVELPDYPQGRPELVAVKYIIPPGKKLGWHHHEAMNHGVLVQGELTIIAKDGQTKVMRAGEVVVEMVDAIHHGENRGTEPVVLYMFYLAQKDMPLSVQHPEIPLE
ncbi:MAG: cupin domain-containing protein [Bacteroidaceae bacterium]|nr:cupin domain-containing protein [Bacteroidaceae bacterium]